ncbi:putative respiratory burst oxidase homolog protein H isoform X3 [Cucumis sativus]|uniref:putative respiratory burst oxidase homolog protein H isoform X3 n=1 Tax=Cucumis sativus TaxID=3659 RepID=UPI0005ED2A16|nr:putative respiratory burst oxidase homolog protein H isoform X3 [Cucumis sativus]
MANENSTQQPSSPFDPNKNNLLSFLDFSVVKSWDDVKTKFHQQMVNGKLFKKNFGVCIGFDERSKHFAYELFDVLSKRKKIKPDDGITLQQLKEFWDELKRDDQETRLAIFFDLCDLNDDDKISKEEIETILKWTASANNLKSIENQIENYASLIIKEFDPDGNGSIETWKYVAIPMLVYTSEGIYTIIKKQIYEVKVLKATVYSKNDLVALRLEKPKRFKYESGSYVYVNCEDIAACEWHPFSITSAPDDEYLSLHIRNAGDWTEKLVERFGKAVEGGKITKIGGIHRQENINDSKWESGEKYPKILIKGPYGAVTQDYKKYKVLLLIGFGTGATPMISILKDILNQIKTHEKEKSTDENGESKFKKAYFYWITRTEESFEWFKGVMNDVAEHDNGRVIEMNNHLSSIKREGDPRSVFVTILQNIQTKIEEIDFISRSRIRARHGKPDWETVFLKLKKEHSGKIGVFFCGDSSFNEVAIKCRKHSDDSTQFEYHHEGT